MKVKIETAKSSLMIEAESYKLPFLIVPKEH